MAHYLKKLFDNLKKRKKLFFFFIAGLIVFAFFLRPKTQALIETQTVKKTLLTQSISVGGTIKAQKSIDLSFPISGKLVYLAVSKGDRVSSYQTIATLDQRTAQKNLENALIAYATARNTFDQTLENYQNRTPQQALNDAMKRILENNQNDLNKAVVSVELQSLAKEQSVLTTPISGIVTRTDVKSAGVNITPAAVFTITDPDSLIFDIDVDEADIGKIKIGQKVRVTMDAFPDKVLKSAVDSIDFVSHTTANGGNAFTVEAGLPQKEEYRVGINGNAEIILAEKTNVLTIPLSSIFDNNKIFVKTQKGYEKKTIALGLQSDTDAEVVKGLSENEVIATQPSQVPKKQTSRIPFIGR